MTLRRDKKEHAPPIVIGLAVSLLGILHKLYPPGSCTVRASPATVPPAMNSR